MKIKPYISITIDNLDFGIQRIRKQWLASGRKEQVDKITDRYALADGWTQEAVDKALEAKVLVKSPQGFKTTKEQRDKLRRRLVG